MLISYRTLLALALVGLASSLNYRVLGNSPVNRNQVEPEKDKADNESVSQLIEARISQMISGHLLEQACEKFCGDSCFLTYYSCSVGQRITGDTCCEYVYSIIGPPPIGN